MRVRYGKDEMGITEIVNWEDIGYAAVFDVHEYHCGWKLYSILSKKSDGSLVYGDCDEATADPADAEIVAHGSVKWDGCSDVATSRERMVHGCNRVDVENWQTAILRACDAAFSMVPKRDGGAWEPEPSIPAVTPNDAGLYGWLALVGGAREWNTCEPEQRVMTGTNCAIVIDKLYGPLAASEVRVRLEYTDDVSDWVVEYMNPTTEQWEEKARWDCQENWPEGGADD